jgi:hypothetical protein
MKEYKESDIRVEKGHVYTKDKKFYLQRDGGFDYWHEIIGVKRGICTLGAPLGHTGYDYCFRGNLKGCASKLNEILNGEKKWTNMN